MRLGCSASCMDQLACGLSSTKDTWTDLQSPRACIGTCGKASTAGKLHSLQPLLLRPLDESASFPAQMLPTAHKLHDLCMNLGGWRGERGNLEGNLFSESSIPINIQ